MAFYGKRIFKGKLGTRAGGSYVTDVQTTAVAATGDNTTAYMGAIRGLLQNGSNLTKTATMLSGVHGVYWLTGTNASTWPKAGIIGEVHTNVTVADACVLALKGDKSTPRAMFGVGDMDKDVNGAVYGLDLTTNSFTPGKANVGYTGADILLSYGVVFKSLGGAPTDNQTGAGFAGIASVSFDTVNGALFVNTGTLNAPVWGKVLHSSTYTQPTVLSTYFSYDSTATIPATQGNNTLAWCGVQRNILSGANLTKTGSGQAAMHGVFWVTGTNASTFPKTAFLGEVHNGVTVADGAFVAMTGLQATPRAMYAVASLDPDQNTASWGMDLSTNSASGIKTGVGYTLGDILLSNNVAIFQNGGAPTNAVTGAQFAGKGSICIDTTNGKPYVNTGTKASPTWVSIGSQT